MRSVDMKERGTVRFEVEVEVEIESEIEIAGFVCFEEEALFSLVCAWEENGRKGKGKGRRR